MSWNPRRMLQIMGTVPSMPVLWLTTEAVLRVRSALDNLAVEYTSDPFPEGGLIIGLQADFPGESDTDLRMRTVRVLAIPPEPNRRDELYSAISFIKGAVPDDAQDQVGQAVKSGVAPVNMFDQKGNCVGLAVCLPSIATMRRGDAEAHAEEMGSLHTPTVTDVSEGLKVTISDVVMAAWTLFSTPMEREVTATEITESTVITGKHRKARTTNVAVIDVRPPAGARYARSGRSVDRDHRWTVRGHWRNQACGPGRTLRRKVWIDGYVAGPEDKPVRDRAKVYRISENSFE